MVLKTTLGQSQRWSLIRVTLGVENEEKNKSNFAYKVFNRQDVLNLGGLNGGISLYLTLFVPANMEHSCLLFHQIFSSIRM